MSNFVNQAINALVNRSGNNLTQTQQDYINVIKNGDSSQGEQIANNLCNSMGLSKEEAITQARNFFHI